MLGAPPRLRCRVCATYQPVSFGTRRRSSMARSCGERFPEIKLGGFVAAPHRMQTARRSKRLAAVPEPGPEASMRSYGQLSCRLDGCRDRFRRCRPRTPGRRSGGRNVGSRLKSDLPRPDSESGRYRPFGSNAASGRERSFKVPDANVSFRISKRTFCAMRPDQGSCQSGVWRSPMRVAGCLRQNLICLAYTTDSSANARWRIWVACFRWSLDMESKSISSLRLGVSSRIIRRVAPMFS